LEKIKSIKEIILRAEYWQILYGWEIDAGRWALSLTSKFRLLLKYD